MFHLRRSKKKKKTPRARTASPPTVTATAKAAKAVALATVAATAATRRATQKLMLNLAINYVYAQQLCLPHGLNTLVGRSETGYITPAFLGSPWHTGLNLEKSGCDGAKKCEKGWKWVKNNPKMLYPQCGRSTKANARGSNDAPSITKYRSLVRPDTQIAALRAHCAKCTPSKPTNLNLTTFFQVINIEKRVLLHVRNIPVSVCSSFREELAGTQHIQRSCS